MITLHYLNVNYPHYDPQDTSLPIRVPEIVFPIHWDEVDDSVEDEEEGDDDESLEVPSEGEDEKSPEPEPDVDGEHEVEEPVDVIVPPVQQPAPPSIPEGTDSEVK